MKIRRARTIAAKLEAAHSAVLELVVAYGAIGVTMRDLERLGVPSDGREFQGLARARLEIRGAFYELTQRPIDDYTEGDEMPPMRRAKP